MAPMRKTRTGKSKRTRKKARRTGGESLVTGVAEAIADMCPVNEPGLCAKLITTPDPDYVILELRIGIDEDMYAQVASSRVNTVEGTLQAVANAYRLTQRKRDD